MNYIEDPIIGYAVHESVRHFSALRDLLVDLTRPSTEKDEPYLQSIRPLISYVCDRNCALVVLIQNGYLWDAEMLIRPVFEATLKILFISYADPIERTRRIQEYWDSLPEINRLKQSERARIALERVFEGTSADNIFRVLILDVEEEARLRSEWPRQQRRTLEQKWSFNEMIRDVEAFMGKIGGASVARALTHSYGISSHLIHADQTGVSLPFDRESRNTVEREKLTRAHAARLVSDRLSLVAAVALAIAFATRQDRAPILKALDSAESFWAELEKHLNDFYNEIESSSQSRA
jgi:hypothetical protein